MTTVESAEKYSDLLGPSVAASPYEYATLFKGDGFMARRRAKKRLKLLKAIDLKLRYILDRGEKVSFVTPGTTVTLGERFFVGWIAQYVNRRALVLTSRRILLLHLDLRHRPLEMVSQLPYASITSVKPSWNGGCAIKLLNRKTVNLQHVPIADRKFVVGFLTGLVQLTNAPFEHKREIEHLCPHCFIYVPAHPSACPACSGRFKSATKAGLLSLLVPGLGGWYLGHRGIALIEIFGTAALWLLLVGAPLLGFALPLSAPPDLAYWLIAGSLLLLVHASDGILTHHFGRKGHFPTGEAPLLAGSIAPFMDRPKPGTDSRNPLKISRTTPPLA